MTRSRGLLMHLSAWQYGVRALVATASAVAVSAMDRWSAYSFGFNLAVPLAGTLLVMSPALVFLRHRGLSSLWPYLLVPMPGALVVRLAELPSRLRAAELPCPRPREILDQPVAGTHCITGVSPAPLLYPADVLFVGLALMAGLVFWSLTRSDTGGEPAEPPRRAATSIGRWIARGYVILSCVLIGASLLYVTLSVAGRLFDWHDLIDRRPVL